MYTLDTNAIIYYLREDAGVVSFFENIFTKFVPIYVSSISEVELFSFSELTFEEIYRIENILETLAVIPLDSRIARIAGSLRRQHNIKTADSIVAATALFTGTTLITRNIRDFQKIPNLILRKV